VDHQTVVVKAIKTLEAAFYVVCEKKSFDVLELSDEGKAMVAAGCTPEVREWSRRIGTCGAADAKHLCHHGHRFFHACSSLLLLLAAWLCFSLLTVLHVASRRCAHDELT